MAIFSRVNLRKYCLLCLLVHNLLIIKQAAINNLLFTLFIFVY